MNPILQGMRQNNGLMSIIHAIKGDPQGMYDNMLRTNPDFKKFVMDNQGKTPEQMARRYGIDLKAINQFLR